ncbi:MAG: hypothetical protein LBB56_07010 [Chitinispirillales bacterium]|jgi:hypothetical protein|nr:hypothetical protein [Chitinispirillales bacterium]
MFQTEHKPSRAVSHIFSLTLLAVFVAYGQLSETRQLTSNNIIALAGNGDTVWIATERGFNYQAPLDAQKEWPGFEAHNLKERLCGFAFGAGGAAALIYKDNLSDSIGFWHFDHKSGKQQQKFFRFSYSMREEGAAEPNGGLIFFDNKFWAPFKDGGMICYDPKNNKIEAFRSDVDGAVSPENLSPPVDKSSASVLSAAATDDNYILVTTSLKLWDYDKSNGWRASGGIPDIDSDKTFTAAFSYFGRLYSFVNIKNNGKEEDALYYLSDDDKWNKALNNTPLAIFPVAQEHFYALFENNQVAMFSGTEEKLTPHQFRVLLAGAAGNDPEKVNDILFLPRTDSIGTLLIATSSGLIFSKSANPMAGGYPDMTLISHARKVKSGESYALPGIIRGGADGKYEKAVFVYKLKKDGNVTIRVYDYNMNLVKTVVNGAKREAETASGRSTDPSADFWDGTNKAGKMASPGVYYFKITSTGGERSFGKVILAK